MSRPIYEPNDQRGIARLGYDKNQLQRRPAPDGSGACPTFRAVLSDDAAPQTFADPASPNTGLENLTTLTWDSWDNGEPTIFTPVLSAGLLSAVTYSAPGLYLVTWRVDWEDFFAGWIITGTGYDGTLYTKYHGPFGAGDPDLWTYGADGFTEMRYWNPNDNFADPTVEIVLGQGSGVSQDVIGGFGGAWSVGTELVITYLCNTDATAVLIPAASS